MGLEQGEWGGLAVSLRGVIRTVSAGVNSRNNSVISVRTGCDSRCVVANVTHRVAVRCLGPAGERNPWLKERD